MWKYLAHLIYMAHVGGLLHIGMYVVVVSTSFIICFHSWMNVAIFDRSLFICGIIVHILPTVLSLLIHGLIILKLKHVNSPIYNILFREGMIWVMLAQIIPFILGCVISIVEITRNFTLLNTQTSLLRKNTTSLSLSFLLVTPIVIIFLNHYVLIHRLLMEIQTIPIAALAPTKNRMS